MQAEQSLYSTYRRLVTQLMHDQEQLPSLPNITLEIRRALNDDTISISALVGLISRDPGLSALLMKHASSPLYRQVQAPKTLNDVVNQLGLREVGRITMLHSVKSLFTLHSAAHKNLFLEAWERLINKASTSAMLARLVGRISAEHALLASLLSEVGSLTVLSGFKSAEEIPSKALYEKLCREYGKSLGVIVLKKWAVDDEYIEITRETGNWFYTKGNTLQVIDVVNLALHHIAQGRASEDELPSLEELPAWKKLPPPLNEIDDDGTLKLLSSHQHDIQLLAQSLR
ncbi:HDOD domain-containing protein [Ectopseudomonas mendocina]|uniref:HDOD domain-containing protein n=1 Tax=Ectopseudomonas mendocina TaxID=300 RepID=A0ABZ2RIH2_ECTME